MECSKYSGENIQYLVIVNFIKYAKIGYLHEMIEHCILKRKMPI